MLELVNGGGVAGESDRRQRERHGDGSADIAALGTCTCWRGAVRVWACLGCATWSRRIGVIEARRRLFMASAAQQSALP